MPQLTRRRIRITLFAIAVLCVAFLGRAWKAAGDHGGQKPAEPFRIAGNLYYVGANDVAAFLITGPRGHILIDGGYPGTAPMIIESIGKLGFDIGDVRLLLNSEPHFDHAGGLAELQRASGAQLWASAASARSIAAGGDSPDNIFPIRMLMWSGLTRYRAPRIDRQLRDGETIRLGPITITAHITGGHTRGCTTWSFPVRDGDRVLDVVSACSLVRMGGMAYPGQRADFERSFRVMRGLPADIWVTSHARLWGRYRKFLARDTARSPVEPFIDPAGYRAYVDSGEAELRRGVVH
jgi:metallo-beta-lactamase class B